jgi:hypothetical protein
MERGRRVLSRTTVARLRLPRLGESGDVLATVREGQRGERAGGLRVALEDGNERARQLARRVVALQRSTSR